MPIITLENLTRAISKRSKAKRRLLKILLEKTEISSSDLIEKVYGIDELESKSERFKQSKSAALRKLMQRTREDLNGLYQIDNQWFEYNFKTRSWRVMI